MKKKLFLKLIINTNRGPLNKKKYSVLEYVDSNYEPKTYAEVFNGNKKELLKYLSKRLHIVQSRLLQGNGLVNNRIFFVKNLTI